MVPGIPKPGLQTWIALFRGINVGGNHILPMAELRKDLEFLKLQNVRTYIQSGNVVFDTNIKATPKAKARLATSIAQRVEERHGFKPQVLLLSPEELRRAVTNNPFPTAAADPKTLHFNFLAEPVSGFDGGPLEAIQTSTESFQLVDSVFYLHAPDGIGRSKLAAKIEKHLGVAITGRNFRTVQKILSMVAH